jgi:hypothetical protein
MNKKILKSMTAMQCSPIALVLGVILVLGIVCYVYRQIIIDTMAICLVIIVCCGAIAGVSMLIISGLRWRGSGIQLPSLEERVPYPEIEKREEDKPAKVIDAITAEADLLAEEAVTLSWTPDGKTLNVKKSRS